MMAYFLPGLALFHVEKNRLLEVNVLVKGQTFHRGKVMSSLSGPYKAATATDI